MASGTLPECRKNLLPALESPTESEDGTVDGKHPDCTDMKLDRTLPAENQEMEHIKVYLRIRPATSEERALRMDDGCISVENDHEVLLSAPATSQAFRTVSHQYQRFAFTRVFPPDASQKQFFDDTVHSIVSDFVRGQNCLVFTYGVTNSGKTYTIQGDQQQANAGILPRSLEVIFGRISGRECAGGAVLKPLMFGNVVRLSADQIKQEKKLKQAILSASSRTSGEISCSQLVQSEHSSRDATEVEMDTDVETANSHATHPPSDMPETQSSFQSDEPNIRFLLWASFAEIYNENIFDLLDPASTVSAARLTRPSTLQLRDGDGRPYIHGLREVQVTSVEEAWRLVQIGRESQHIASTRLNRASSRSHSIFTLRLIQVADVDRPNVARVASLSFCDLAGAERNTAAGGINERIKEAGNINLSLMTLGRCIESLRRNQARRDQSTAARASTVVPFRDSRLTRMFQGFLCGEGRVVMITNVSPCANVFDETLHAVNYSALACQVVVGPFLRKHEAAAAASKVVPEKKRETIEEASTFTDAEDNDKQHASDEDVPTVWKDQRQKLVNVVKKLQNALAEERQTKAALETQIRTEVCEEMQKQLVRIEADHQELLRNRQEILEEKYDRKMEIYMEAVQKSCKRQRRGDDEDDYVPSVDLHAAEDKLTKYTDEIKALKSKNDEIAREKLAEDAAKAVEKVSDEHGKATRAHRKRTVGVLDQVESEVSEEPVHRLRSSSRRPVK